MAVELPGLPGSVGGVRQEIYQARENQSRQRDEKGVFMTQDDARALLKQSDFFFDEDDEMPVGLWINLNDVFGWACSDTEQVQDDELIPVACLFRQYGWCGVLYWVSQKRGGSHSEFKDINRYIEFVRNEEEVIQQVPNDSKRAYFKISYTLGEEFS